MIFNHREMMMRRYAGKVADSGSPLAEKVRQALQDANVQAAFRISCIAQGIARLERTAPGNGEEPQK